MLVFYIRLSIKLYLKGTQCSLYSDEMRAKQCSKSLELSNALNALNLQPKIIFNLYRQVLKLFYFYRQKFHFKIFITNYTRDIFVYHTWILHIVKYMQ